MSGNTFQIEENFYGNVVEKIPDRENSLISIRYQAFPNFQFFVKT